MRGGPEMRQAGARLARFAVGGRVGRHGTRRRSAPVETLSAVVTMLKLLIACPPVPMAHAITAPLACAVSAAVSRDEDAPTEGGPAAGA